MNHNAVISVSGIHFEAAFNKFEPLVQVCEHDLIFQMQIIFHKLDVISPFWLTPSIYCACLIFIRTTASFQIRLYITIVAFCENAGRIYPSVVSHVTSNST